MSNKTKSNHNQLRHELDVVCEERRQIVYRGRIGADRARYAMFGPMSTPTVETVAVTQNTEANTEAFDAPLLDQPAVIVSNSQLVNLEASRKQVEAAHEYILPA